MELSTDLNLFEAFSSVRVSQVCVRWNHGEPVGFEQRVKARYHQLSKGGVAGCSGALTWPLFLQLASVFFAREDAQVTLVQ